MAQRQVQSILWILLFSCMSMKSKAQLTQADSVLFINSFVEPIYISYWTYPNYRWYAYDSIKSKQGLTDLMNREFPYMPADVTKTVYNEINLGGLKFDSVINNSFNHYPSIYGQTNPVVKLSYELHNKPDTAYAAYTPSVAGAGSSCKTVFLLLHGTGTNTTSQFMQNNGYANIYCAVKTKCLQYGDVFSYCKPNEDWRAIYWNRKKLGDYVFSYLEATGHNYGTNYLIENIALVKYLKTKYQRVVLLGISEGGYAALLNSFYSEPDAAIISGGYSISFDTYLWSQFTLSSRFGNLPQTIIRDTVKSIINQKSTQYLFTWGDGDPVALMDPEHDFHYTQNYLNNPGKCSYFYNFTQHTFPPCGTLDTFFQRVTRQPKAQLYAADSNCHSDSMKLKIAFCGQSPFQFNLYKNDTLYASMLSLTDTMLINLTQSGTYQVKEIDDASVYVGVNSQTFTYIKDTMVQWNLVSNNFICDSAKSEIIFNLQGSSPWKLIKNYNGITSIDSIIQSSNTQYYANGQLSFLQLTDRHNCSLTLNQAIDIQDSALQVTFGTTQYNCSSHKTGIPIQFQGRSPWTLQYIKNGIPNQLISFSNSSTFYFENGAYYFASASDGNGCQLPLNQTFLFSSDTLEVTSGIPSYSCDSVKTNYPFNVEGNFPITLNYTKNTIPFTKTFTSSVGSLSLTNGNYQFLQATDATGCQVNVPLSMNFNYDTLEVVLQNPVYVCDSQKNKIKFTLEGNKPWTIFYLENSILKYVTTSISSYDLYVNNGTTVIQYVKDSSNCIKTLNQNFVLNNESLSCQIGQPAYSCDSTKAKVHFELHGQIPFVISYYENSVLKQFTSSSKSFDRYFANGNYQFASITDYTSCSQNLNVNFSISFNPIAVNLTSPLYDCDSSKTKITFSCQGNSPWTIQYVENNISKQITSTNANFTRWFSNGNFVFLTCKDATGCQALINQQYNFDFEPINVALASNSYNCDSNKVPLQFSLNGQSPFTIHYLQNGLPQQWLSYGSSFETFVSNGSYQFVSITDATNCQALMNQSLLSNYQPLNFSMSLPTFDCDSLKTRITFTSQGNGVRQLHYTENNISKTMQLTNTVETRWFSNGQYVFLSCSDSTNCMTQINQSFTFNYQPLTASIVNSLYDCDSQKLKIILAFSGNGPWNIQYTNGTTNFTALAISNVYNLFLPNGTWNITQINDLGNGCSVLLNQQFNTNYQAINASLSSLMYDCVSNTTQTTITSFGNAPISLFINEFSTNSIDTIDVLSNQQLVSFQPGDYLIQKVRDNTGCEFMLNQYVSQQYQPLSFMPDTSFIVCDSSKLKYSYHTTGDGPWVLIYKNSITGDVFQHVDVDSSSSIYLETGTYKLLEVSDSKCSITLNETIVNSYSKLNCVVSSPEVNCDSGKSYVIIYTTGIPPFTFHMLKDNLGLTYTTNQFIDTLYLEKGNWYFDQVTDSLNCSYSLNKSFTIDYKGFKFNNWYHTYNCNSDSSFIYFSIEYDSPITIDYNFNQQLYQYHLNGIDSFYLANGHYNFLAVKDTFGCELILNDTLHVDNETIDFQELQTEALCDVKEHDVQFTLQGKSPWLLDYNFQNITYQVSFQDSLVQWQIPSGDYYLVRVKDYNGCEKEIDTSFYLKPFLQQQPILRYEDYYLVTQQTNLLYRWYRDGELLPQVNSFKIPPFGSGNYVVSVQDSTGCIYVSNEINLNFVNDINVYPNPAHDVLSILINDNYGSFWKYSILDITGKIAMKGESEWPYHQLNVGSLAHGIYQIVIEYDNLLFNGIKVQQFRKDD